LLPSALPTELHESGVTHGRIRTYDLLVDKRILLN
jgi:hypothetical protein